MEYFEYIKVNATNTTLDGENSKATENEDGETSVPPKK